MAPGFSGHLPALTPLAAALLLALSTPTNAIAQTDPATEQQLSAVVVTASGFEQEVKKAPASISVVTRQELETQRAGSLAEALSNVEGVDVNATSDKTGGLSISIRGMPSDYTLILVDGRRQNSAGDITPNNFGGTSSHFLPPVNAIERIEVIRGPMSTLYGSDAMGGVVNIITRKVSDTWYGSISLDGTLQENRDRGDLYGANFYLAGPLKKDMLGLQLRGKTAHRDGSKLEATGDGEGNTTVSSFGRNPVESDIHSLGARLTLTPTKAHEIYLDLDATRQTYNNKGGAMGTLGSGGYADKQKYNRDQVVLAHNGNFSFGRIESSITRNETETIGRLIPNNTPGKVALSPRELTATNTILDTKLLAPVGQSHFLTVGAQYWDAEMVDGVAPEPYTHKQWALFGEDEWHFTDSAALTLGARYDRHNRFGSHFSPRAYVVWDATSNWTVKGGVSRGFKTPKLNQLADGITGFGGQGTIPLVGSPSLKPEISTSYELGTIYDNQRGFTAGATVFFNQFKDKIASGDGLPNCSWTPEPNRPGCVDFGNWPAVNLFGQSVNIDKAETKGIELNARFPINDRLSANANYTFTRSVQKSGSNAGDPLYDTPKHVVNARLNLKVTPQVDTWLQAQYRSERWRSDDTARAALGNYKSTTLLNLGVNYRVSQSFSVNAVIYNLLDRDFLEYGAYTNNSGGTSYANLHANTEEGRRIWVSGTYTF